MMKINFCCLMILMVGCSTYSKKQCETNDWYQLGYNSAREGSTAIEGLSHYGQYCTQEHGVAVDQQKFQDGFSKGLEYLCTEEQGRLFGQTGHTYRGTCPKEKEASFTKTYESGRMDFLIQKVQTLEFEVSNLQSQLSSKDAQIFSLQGQVGSQHCP